MRKYTRSMLRGIFEGEISAFYRADAVLVLAQQPCLSKDRHDIGGLMSFAHRFAGQAGTNFTGYFNGWMKHFKEVDAPFILVKIAGKNWILYKERIV